MIAYITNVLHSEVFLSNSAIMLVKSTVLFAIAIVDISMKWEITTNHMTTALINELIIFLIHMKIFKLNMFDSRKYISLRIRLHR